MRSLGEFTLTCAVFAVLWFGIAVAGPVALVVYFGAGLLVGCLFTESPGTMRRRRIAKGCCMRCGYDLRGSKHSLICPECGWRFEAYGTGKFAEGKSRVELRPTERGE